MSIPSYIGGNLENDPFAQFNLNFDDLQKGDDVELDLPTFEKRDESELDFPELTSPMTQEIHMSPNHEVKNHSQRGRIAKIALLAFSALAFVGCIVAAPFTGGLSLIGSGAILVGALVTLGVLLYKIKKDSDEENDTYEQMYDNAFERMANRRLEAQQLPQEDSPVVERKDDLPEEF